MNLALSFNQQSHQSGQYFGLYTALVTNINDPDGWGRIKVKLTTMDGTLETDWARTASLYAGPSYGMCFGYGVDEEVLLMFEQGDVNRPIVVGRIWNKLDKPPVLQESNKNQILSIKTKTGHHIDFGEEDNKHIEITTKDGISIKMSDTDKKVTLTTKDGKGSVEMDNTGKITIAGEGDYSLDAKGAGTEKFGGDLTIKSTGKITLDSNGTKLIVDGSSGQISLKATGSIKVEGAMVDIQAQANATIKAGAMMTVQGTLVKIN